MIYTSATSALRRQRQEEVSSAKLTLHTESQISLTYIIKPSLQTKHQKEMVYFKGVNEAKKKSLPQAAIMVLS